MTDSPPATERKPYAGTTTAERERLKADAAGMYYGDTPQSEIVAFMREQTGWGADHARATFREWAAEWAATYVDAIATERAEAARFYKRMSEQAERDSDRIAARARLDKILGLETPAAISIAAEHSGRVEHDHGVSEAVELLRSLRDDV